MAKPKTAPVTQDTAVHKALVVSVYGANPTVRGDPLTYIGRTRTTGACLLGALSTRRLCRGVLCFSKSSGTCDSGRRLFAHWYPASRIDHVSPRSVGNSQHCPLARPDRKPNLWAEGSHPASDRQLSSLGCVPDRAVFCGALHYIPS